MQKMFMVSKAIHQNHILHTVTHVLWVVGHDKNKLHHLGSCFFNAFFHMRYKNIFVYIQYVKHEMLKSDNAFFKGDFCRFQKQHFMKF